RVHAVVERVTLRAGVNPGRDGTHGTGGPESADLRRRVFVGPAHGRVRDHHAARRRALHVHPPLDGGGPGRGLGQGVTRPAARALYSSGNAIPNLSHSATTSR